MATIGSAGKLLNRIAPDLAARAAPDRARACACRPYNPAMPLSADRCICLRKVEYSETSQILTLFGRSHGLMRVIAKGAHRTTKAGASKFGGGIDLLDIGQAVFTLDHEKQLGTLTEWTLLEGHLEMRRSLRAMYLAQYAAELVGLLIEEHDPHPELFDRLEQTLTELPTPRVEESFLAFQLDLLRETGYLAELGACVSCSGLLADREPAFFSANRGGVVCRNCEGVIPDRMPIDARLLRMVQTILRLPRTDGAAQRLPRLTRHQTDPINRLFAQHVEHTLQRRLRLPQFILNNGK
ncbi:MAG: repair protein RecO [Phycisphaerales bacterium]|jgi:DNA repair protein RecO (recombination protein O)|nr:repair protein RecO [Phycisphaerales bacterium]